MSTSQDEILEIIESTEASPTTSKHNKKHYFKMKPNKISSPDHSTISSIHSLTKASDLSEMFARPNKKLPPVAKARKLHKIKSAKAQLDATSDDLTSETTNSEHYESTSHKSDLQSYRDKLKNRFKLIKNHSSKQLLNEVKMKTFKEHVSGVVGLNKSLASMKHENVDIETQLRAHEECLPQESKDCVSKAEKYHFFCETKNDFIADNQINLAQSTEVLIDGETPTINHKAICVDREIFDAENELFANFTRNKLHLYDKLNEEPRIFADEGLYVVKKPKIPDGHYNILEQRLLADNDKKWFNSEGEIIFSENPHINQSYRPENYSTPSKIELEIRKPILDNISDYSIESVTTLSNFLEININNVKFKHHPLFSAEHVLQEKLLTAYDSYRELIVSNQIERISNRLDASRKSKLALEKANENVNQSDLHKINTQITNLRGNYFDESKKFRDNLKTILHTWKGIKQIRECNNFINTNIQLIIRKENCNYEEEKIIYDCMIHEIYKELICEAEKDYDFKLREYKNAFIAWKRLEDESDKPIKPNKLDRDLIKKDLLELAKDCFKSPGEPIINFSLSHECEITKIVENSKEKLRRNALSSTKIYLRLLCNNYEIFKSRLMPLSETFVCFFDESFSLKLHKIPQSICVEIYEQPSTLLKRKIGEIDLSIPAKNGPNKLQEFFFIKDELVHYKHEGIGSGLNFDEIVKQYNLANLNCDGYLFTSGFVTSSITWDVKCVEDTPMHELLDINGHINLNKLTEWTQNINLDPQDPKNAVIFEYLKTYANIPDGLKKPLKNYFRLNPHQNNLFVPNPNEFFTNIRFKLLELRELNEPEFVGMIVPNRLNEIPSNILSSYKRRLAIDNSEETLLEENDDEINVKRSHGRKILRQIHTQIFQLCRTAENNLCFEDVVNEKTVPLIETYIRTVISNCLNWFRIQPGVAKPLPKIKPHENETLNIIRNSAPPKILINLIGAVNVPTRKDYSVVNRRKSVRSQTSTRTGTITDLDKMEVKPFVEISYQNLKVRSVVGDGKNPNWNEVLTIPLESTNTDYLSPNALYGSINIDLFDEIDDNKVENKSINWLGNIQIPISSICLMNKLEGYFLVKTPAILLNYDQEHQLSSASSTRINNTISVYTYINLSITVHPFIPKLNPDMESLPCNEPPYLKNHIFDWNHKYNMAHPNRKFSALAIDSHGKSTCLTRYLKSLETPQINSDGFDVTADQCARYISMIPFTESNGFYQNIWLSTEQLLKLSIGSVIDHAIALTCYFLTLNLEVWLLLGFGIPHGITAYVFVREYNQDNLIPIHFIYDVSTGLKHNLLDQHCPLQKVFCIISETNIWGNIQSNNDIATTRFDFSRRFDWTPLFDYHTSAPTNSIQHKLLYTVSYDVHNLEMVIEKKLRKKIAKQRLHQRTIWNHYYSNLFKNMMNKLEINSMRGKTNYDGIPEMQEIFTTHKINGFIKLLPFSSVNNIVDTIQKTRVYVSDSNEIEFASAVYLHAYSNRILVVWITFAAINKN